MGSVTSSDLKCASTDTCFRALLLFPWCHLPSPIFNGLNNKIKAVPAVTVTVARQPLNQSSRRQRMKLVKLSPALAI